MKLIPLTRGLFAKVSDEDYDHLMKWDWNALKGHTNYYACRTQRTESGKRIKISMHRYILGLTDPNIQGDHINHDTLDNQRNNLRICTQHENARNRKSRKESTSKYLGVHKAIANKTYMTKRGLVTNTRITWVAKIRGPERELFLGGFPFTDDGEVLAAKAYDTAAKIYHKEFANLNFKD